MDIVTFLTYDANQIQIHKPVFKFSGNKDIFLAEWFVSFSTVLSIVDKIGMTVFQTFR